MRLIPVLFLILIIAGCGQPDKGSYEVMSTETGSDGTHVRINVFTISSTDEEAISSAFSNAWMSVINDNLKIQTDLLIIDTEYSNRPVSKLIVPMQAVRDYKDNKIDDNTFIAQIKLEEPDIIVKQYRYPGMDETLSYNPGFVWPNETVTEIKEEIVEENKTEEIELPQEKCGDGNCQINENCSYCPEDCSCKKGYICSSLAKCIKPMCNRNSDCDDGDECTEDDCVKAGTEKANCTYTLITSCGASASTGWKTGIVTLPTQVNNEHVFFDFETQSITTDYNIGDVFTNFFLDLMGECNEESVCTEIVQENSLSFDEMITVPSDFSAGGGPQISVGDRFWVKTPSGNYGKIEITAKEEETSMTFKWGYLE